MDFQKNEVTALRIVFMGTPEFAVPSLEMLVREGYEVVTVVTQPDKPKAGARKRLCSRKRVCNKKQYRGFAAVKGKNP